MKENFWGNVTNDVSWAWVGFIVGAIIFTEYNFWLLFLGEIVGLFVIWVLCATLNALLGKI